MDILDIPAKRRIDNTLQPWVEILLKIRVCVLYFGTALYPGAFIA
jgi:hypothetical protein